MDRGGGQHRGDGVRVLVGGHGDGGVDAGGFSLRSTQVIDDGSFGPRGGSFENGLRGKCLNRRGGTVGCT